MYRQLRIAVVIPAFNEAEAILAVVRSVPSFVDEVVVVDDASRDDTAQLARESERKPTVLCHPVNRGVGAAIATGYRHAMSRGADVAVVMAGDGQMDPEDLPSILNPIAEGRADFVKGNRFAHQELFVQMPPIRILGNCILSYLTKVTSGYRHVFDSQCGYTAITTAALRRLELDGLFPRYGYPNDLLARLFSSGARVAEVPVRPIYGPTWKSGVRLTTVIYPISYVLLMSWYNRVQRARSIPTTSVEPMTAASLPSETKRLCG